MSHLRLVTAPAERPARRSYRRRPPVFSQAETLRLRAALRSARALFGTWNCAGDALRTCPRTLQHAATGRTPVSADVALRLARALGKPLDALLRPLSDASCCPTCGARRAP